MNDLTLASGTYPVPVRALEAAQDIRMIKAMLTNIAQFAEARIMERLWEIHREINDDALFGEFVSIHLDMKPDQALRYVTTWDGARQNRGLRELAQQSPNEALMLVQQLAESGLEDISKVDSEVARVLALPTRKRHAALRDLIDNQQAVVKGRNPADVEKIRALEAERDDALATMESYQNVVSMSLAPGRDLTCQATELGHKARDLCANLPDRLRELPTTATLSIEQVIEQCEHTINCTEAMINECSQWLAKQGNQDE